MKINLKKYIKINIEEIIFIIINTINWISIELYQIELNNVEKRTNSELIYVALSISMMTWFLVYKIIIPIYKIIKVRVINYVKRIIKK